MDDKKEYVELAPVKASNKMQLKSFWLPLGVLLLIVIVVFFIFHSMYKITTALSKLKQEVTLVDQKEVTLPMNIPKSLDYIQQELSALSAKEAKNMNAPETLTNCSVLIDLIVEATELKLLLKQGKPYATTLAKIALITKNNTELVRLTTLLQVNANTGILNNYQLKNEFSKIISELVASYHYKASEDKWLEKGKLYLSKIISIRKIGNKAKNDGGIDEAIIEINSALEIDDLVKARDILLALPDLRSIHAQNWLKKIKDNIEMQQAVQGMLDIIKHTYNCNSI